MDVQMRKNAADRAVAVLMLPYLEGSVTRDQRQVQSMVRLIDDMSCHTAATTCRSVPPARPVLRQLAAWWQPEPQPGYAAAPLPAPTS
jgi:hypothetical protein